MEQKAKIISALTAISENINTIIDVFSSEDIEEEKPSKPTKINGVSRKAKEDEEVLPDIEGDITEDDLKELSFNNLRKIAKQLGADTTGSRKEVIEHILEAKKSETDEDVEEDGEDEEEEKPVAKKSPIKMKKRADEEDEEEPEDEVELQVNEAVKDMTTEEIADFLADSGIRAKGKREALIAAVVKAVREGTIELEDDEDEDNDVSEPEDEDTEDNDTDTDDTDGEDTEYGVNDVDNPEMTAARKKALEKHRKTLNTDFKNGDITEEDLREWAVENGVATEKEVKKMKDKQLLDLYFEETALYFDDGGKEIDSTGSEEHEAYEVNGVPYCCGTPLTYDKKHKTYKCEVCGSEYEE